jgi:hypothetical protein
VAQAVISHIPLALSGCQLAYIFCGADVPTRLVGTHMSGLIPLRPFADLLQNSGIVQPAPLAPNDMSSSARTMQARVNAE